MFGLLAVVATKVLGLFGSGLLSSVLGVITNGQTQTTARLGLFTSLFASALTAEVEHRRIASSERIALWGSIWYKLLFYTVVLPPALYTGAVFIDSIFHFSWNVDKAPERFESWGFIILNTFVGVTGAVGGVIGFAKAWFRK